MKVEYLAPIKEYFYDQSKLFVELFFLASMYLCWLWSTCYNFLRSGVIECISFRFLEINSAQSRLNDQTCNACRKRLTKNQKIKIAISYTVRLYVFGVSFCSLHNILFLFPPVSSSSCCYFTNVVI